MQPSDQTCEIQPAPIEVTDDPAQEELQQRYIEQQQRLTCTGCGETAEIF